MSDDVVIPFNTLNHYDVSSNQRIREEKRMEYMKAINNEACAFIANALSKNPNIVSDCNYIIIYKVKGELYCRTITSPKKAYSVKSTFNNHKSDIDLAKKIVIRAYDKARHLYNGYNVQLITNVGNVIGRIIIKPT